MLALVSSKPALFELQKKIKPKDRINYVNARCRRDHFFTDFFFQLDLCFRRFRPVKLLVTETNEDTIASNVNSIRDA